jgi:hypothetical protein
MFADAGDVGIWIPALRVIASRAIIIIFIVMVSVNGDITLRN